MVAKYILAVLSMVFLGAALWRGAQEEFRPGPASRTWLVVGTIFAAVSVWLWLQ